MKKNNIINFGAIADGKTLNTVAVQNAIDECSKNGGGTVVFPDGVFVLSTVFLKSNVHIELLAERRIFQRNTQCVSLTE